MAKVLISAVLASVPGSAQLSVACSTVLQATESWAGPGNEAMPSSSNAFVPQVTEEHSSVKPSV